MNLRILVLIIFLGALALTGCGQKEAALTDAEKATIAQEVLQAGNGFEAAAEKMDPDAITKYIADNPDFLFIDQEGKGYSYAELKKFWADFLAQFSAQTNPLRTVKVIVLGRDAALYSWQGGGNMTQKDGTVLKCFPYSGTDIFRKIGNEWKCVYIHESGLPPIPVKPAEPAQKK